MKLVNPKRAEPALDYILKDPIGNKYFYKNGLSKSKEDEIQHNFEKESHIVKLNFKLKNAIVFHLLKVQEERNKPSMEDLILQLQKKKREEAADPVKAREAKK